MAENSRSEGPLRGFVAIRWKAERFWPPSGAVLSRTNEPTTHWRPEPLAFLRVPLDHDVGGELERIALAKGHGRQPVLGLGDQRLGPAA